MKEPDFIKRKGRKASIFFKLNLIFKDFGNNSYYVSCKPLKGILYANLDMKELTKLGCYKKVGKSEKRGSKIKLENCEFMKNESTRIDLFFRYIPLMDKVYDDKLLILFRETDGDSNKLQLLKYEVFLNV